MMPMIHDAFWWGAFALLAFVAWRAAERFNFRPAAFDLRGRFGDRFGLGGTTEARAWTPPPPRSSGNSAFDDWRDSELARLEAERQTLEAKLQAFEGFVDKLRRAKDRETFDRFMAAHRELPQSMAEPMAATASTRPSDPARR